MRTLNLLKVKLKEWNKYVFGDIRIKKYNILKEIDLIDRLEIEGNLSESVCKETEVKIRTRRNSGWGRI